MNLEAIQETLRKEGLDGWLFFDHHQRDPLAYRVLGLKPPSHGPTRRWYYYVPAQGEPRGLVHRIESWMLEKLPGTKTPYSTWQEQAEGLQRTMAGARRVAMQYSPRCAVPLISNVDAGTVELVREAGAEVVSSAGLIQYFEARWTQANLERHLEAGRVVDEARRATFQMVFDCMRANGRLNEFEVSQFLRRRFTEGGLFTDESPIVAVNENASNPHYYPKEEASQSIRNGDVVLMDMWAKVNSEEGVYYDVTWMGYCGATPPAELLNVFGVVREARERAVKLVMDSVAAGRELRGFEVDDAARGVIREHGFADKFVHRTGHSIGVEVHGAGANMDNFETHDDRRIIPWTCFSVEPGIYFPKFGVRSEVNVFVGETGARVTGEVQDNLVTM